MEKYYDVKSNTYIFKENDILYMDVKFNFNLNIKTINIKARDIDAWNIDAGDIRFFAICIAYNKLLCKSFCGFRKNSLIKCLDSKIIIKGEKK